MQEKSLKDKLLSEVISATNEVEATTAIKSIMEALHIGQDYQSMYRIGEELKLYSDKLFAIQTKHFHLTTPRKLPELQEIRNEVGFISREIIDKFTPPVTMLKNLVEENKKVVVYDAIQYIDNNPSEFEGVTKSSRESYVGGTPMYKEWVQLRAISYSNYQYLDKVISSTDTFLHALASEIRAGDIVEKQNAR
jgi:hypothetical protein